MNSPATKNALAVTASGMMTAVGLNAPSTCAAIRCAIDNFQETRFLDGAGEWQIGSEVPLDDNITGIAKLLHMSVSAIRECMASTPNLSLETTPLILCLPEETRIGRVIIDDQRFLDDVQSLLAITLDVRSTVLTHGHTAAAVALRQAHGLLADSNTTAVLVCGVDSLLSARQMRSLEARSRLLHSENSNGFIPGEAAAAILLQRAQPNDVCVVNSMGFAMETAPINSGKPLRAEGLTKAIRQALDESALELHHLDYRITDVTGEQYYFKEATLALTRLMRQRTETFDIMHPTDCVGETGAATGPLILGYQHYLSTQPGDNRRKQLLAHFSDDDGKRAALILTTGVQSNG